jgi:Domain of unknown function (DUF4407)
MSTASGYSGRAAGVPGARAQDQAVGVRTPAVSWFRRLLARLGGADSAVLDRAVVDATEMTGRGFAALIPAIFGGLAATVAFEYAYSLPVAGAAVAGCAWALLVLLFDLSLMSAAPGRGLASRVVTYGTRALISVLAAFTFAGPLVLFMYARDITVRMLADQQTDLAAYNHDHIVAVYAPAISADSSQIAAGQGDIDAANRAVAGLLRATENAGVQALCESGGLSGEFGCQRGTGLTGKGPAYLVRLGQLRNDQVNLAAARAQAAAVRARLAPRIQALQADRTTAQRQERSAYQAAQARYLADNGLIARWRALGELERAHPIIATDVRLLEALIVAVDLSAVLAKVSSRTPSYDRVLEAERRKVTLDATRSDEEASGELDRWRAERDASAEIDDARQEARVDVELERLQAHVEVQRWRIRGWVSQQTGGPPPFAARGDPPWSPSSRNAAGRDHRGTGPDPRIQAVSLGQFLRDSRPHEREPVAMAPALRRLSWIGVAVLSALTVAALLARAAHATLTAGWIAPAALAASLALAIYTRGFRQGPSWAQRAAFGLALASLALPAVIFALNI